MTKRYTVTPALLSACSAARRAREARNEMQVDAADALNMHQSNLSRLESGGFGATISEDVQADLIALFKRYGIEEPRWIETNIKRTPSLRRSKAVPQNGTVAFSPPATGSFPALLDHVLGMVAGGKIGPADAKALLLTAVASQ